MIDKVKEELAELEAEISSRSRAKLEAELGDLLFTVVNLARKLRIDPEVALLGATKKFVTRFQRLEQLAKARGLFIEKMTLTELDMLWEAAKSGQ